MYHAQNFCLNLYNSSPVPSLDVNSDPPYKNTMRSVLCLTKVTILKRVRDSEFSFKTRNLEHVRLKTERGAKIYIRLPIHFKVRSI